MSSKVSIIVPTRNRCGFLRQALRCGLAQTWPETELVVVDEASTDGTVAMLADEFPKVQVVRHDVPRGTGGARNSGIAASTGKWVLFLDDDDLLHREHVEALVRASLEAPANCIVSGRWRRFVTVSNEVRLGPVVCAPPDRRGIEMLVEIIEPRGEATICGHSVLWPRRAFADVLWDEGISTNGDSDFFGRVILAGSRIVGREVGMAYYRVHSGERVSSEGSSGGTPLRGLLSAARYRLKWSQLLLSHPERELCGEAMRNGFMALLIGLSGVPDAKQLVPLLEDAYRLWGGQDFYISSPPRNAFKRRIAETVLKIGGPLALHWLLNQTSQPQQSRQAQLEGYRMPANDADKSDVAAIRSFE